MPPLDWRGRAALWGGEAGPKPTGLVFFGGGEYAQAGGAREVGVNVGCSQGWGEGVAIAVVGWGAPLGEDGGRSVTSQLSSSCSSPRRGLGDLCLNPFRLLFRPLNFHSSLPTLPVTTLEPRNPIPSMSSLLRRDSPQLSPLVI